MGGRYENKEEAKMKCFKCEENLEEKKSMKGGAKDEKELFKTGYHL